MLCAVSVDEARQIIADNDATMITRIEAAGILAVSEDATIGDLVICLRCRGVIGELAASALYRRTGRRNAKSFRDYARADQWEQFLIRRRLEREVESAM